MGTGEQDDRRVREPGRERHLWLSLPLMGGGWSGWLSNCPDAGPELGQGTGGGGGGALKMLGFVGHGSRSGGKLFC